MNTIPSSLDQLTVPNAPPRVQSIRLDYIDGLRALALLMVLLYHCWLFSGCPWLHWWNIIGNGYIGVNLFLTLSGFCLYWPFVKDKSRKSPTLKEFAKRRAHRILPPYYIALILFTVSATILNLMHMSWPEGPNGSLNRLWEAAAWHLLMLHHLNPDQIATIDTPLWSLGLEINLYIAMPILVVLARKYNIRVAVSVATIVTLAYRFWLNWYIGGSASWETVGHQTAFTLCYFVPGRWIEFALGMWAAELVAERSVNTKPRVPYGWLSGGCLLSAFLLGQRYGIFNPVSDALDGLGFFFLILSASHHSPSHGRFSIPALLRHPSLVKLGMISYSVYLIHQPLLRLAIESSHRFLKHNSLQFIVSFVVFVPLIVLISKLFYHLFERPFVNSPSNRRAAIHLAAPPQEQPAA